MFLLSKNNFVLLSIIVLLSSCMSTKKVTYFQDKESVDAALSKRQDHAQGRPPDTSLLHDPRVSRALQPLETHRCRHHHHDLRSEHHLRLPRG